jgi:ATP-dependent exoDNAse (exonuclease V) beta subunit
MAAAGLAAEWRATSGQTHAFRVPAAPEAPVPQDQGRTKDQAPSAKDHPDDLDPLVATPAVRRASEVGAPGASITMEEAAGAESERLLGTVVHRLLQALGTTAGETDDLAAIAEQLLRPEEAAGLADLRDFSARAATAYRALCNHPDVRRLYTATDVLHEVPFTMRHEGSVVRGTIDCLVRVGEGEVAVLEFKTGRPRPEHAGQVALYASVAGALFPGATVTQKLIYTDLGAIP